MVTQTNHSAEGLDAKDFAEKVLKSDKYVLVDFWATWCMPCLMMAPVLDEISKELSDKLVVYKVNTEEPENQALAMQYDIRSIPNMKLFKDGNMIKDFIGFRTKESFLEELNKIMK
jgi:thioredoxin 1